MKRRIILVLLTVGLLLPAAAASEQAEITDLLPAGDSITLRWQDIGADAYQVWRASSPDGTYLPVAQTQETTYKDTGLKAGSVYYYKVCPYWESGRRYGPFSPPEGQCCVRIVDAPAVSNPCYRQGRTIRVRGLMLHSVGCPQESAAVFAASWDRPSANVLVHAVIEPTGSVWQLADWEMRCWHCGGEGNDSHVGVEMTEPNELRYLEGDAFVWSGDAAETALKNYNTAVSLFASLCFRYNLDPLRDVCSHGEGGERGTASGHGDPEHLWNGLGLALSMDTFRQDVLRKMQGTYQERGLECQTGRIVTVRAEVLNIRSGAGTGYPVEGTLYRGERAAITAVRQGGEHLWGRLCSGGWISLTYAD